MRCTRAQYAIHLDREGECPPGLRERAIAHAATCPGCAEELRLVEASARELARLRASNPRVPDPAALTEAIVRELERARGRERIRASRIADSLPFFSFPRARVALQSAAWAVLLLFAAQTLLDADSMRRLEERLGRQSGARHWSAGPAGGSPRMESLAGLGPLGGIDMSTLLRELQIVAMPAPPELERLRAKYPDLWTIGLQDGLDERERHVLLTEGPALLKELEQLIKLGGGANER